MASLWTGRSLLIDSLVVSRAWDGICEVIARRCGLMCGTFARCVDAACRLVGFGCIGPPGRRLPSSSRSSLRKSGKNIASYSWIVIKLLLCLIFNTKVWYKKGNLGRTYKLLYPIGNRECFSFHGSNGIIGNLGVVILFTSFVYTKCE